MDVLLIKNVERRMENDSKSEIHGKVQKKRRRKRKCGKEDGDLDVLQSNV